MCFVKWKHNIEDKEGLSYQEHLVYRYGTNTTLNTCFQIALSPANQDSFSHASTNIFLPEVSPMQNICVL